MQEDSYLALCWIPFIQVHIGFSNLESQHIQVSVCVEHVVTEHSGVVIIKWNSFTVLDEDIL